MVKFTHIFFSDFFLYRMTSSKRWCVKRKAVCGYIIIDSFTCIPIGRKIINFIQSMPCAWFYNICIYIRIEDICEPQQRWIFLKISVWLRQCEDFDLKVYYFAFCFTQLRSKASEPVHLVTSLPVRSMLSVWGMSADVKMDSKRALTSSIKKHFVIVGNNEII